MTSVRATRKSARIVNRDTSIYKDSSDSEESDIAANKSDDEYMAPSDASKKRSRGPRKPNKKSKTVNRAAPKSVEELGTDFEENLLYKALSKPDLSTQELALEWIEEYIENEENNKDSELIASLVNLLLRSCGCIYLLQPHDLVNLESAAETIGELTIAFEKQQYHEYPFISNNKDLKFFRKNVCEFFEDLIYLAHEKGILYQGNEDEEDSDEERETVLTSPLMNKILTWLTSLSSCTVRPLRHISTTILLTIQTKLCDIVVSITATLEKYQRQLSNATNKNKGNKKSRNGKADAISKNINIYHNHKETIYEYFGEITETTFIHRYRDVDASIRQECLRQLGQWMIIYPDFFFQSSYLRYFGWLLSDPSNHVRAEVTKVLLKLYKNASNGNQNMSIGFRQFTERFKKQLINMSRKDSDFNVKYNLIVICCELLKIGFLEENDNLQITQLFFYILDYGSGFGHASDEKLKVELSRFINLVNLESSKVELEKYSIFTENYESPQFGNGHGKLNINDCLKTKNLIKFLKKAYDNYLKNKPMTESEFPKNRNFTPIATIFKSLYRLPSYTKSWEFLVRYLLFDLSSVNFHPKLGDIEEGNVEVTEFKKLLELSGESDYYYLLNFINGSITSIFSSNFKRSKEESESEENQTSVSIKLIDYLPAIQKSLSKSKDQFLIFLDLWNVLLSSSSHSDNIYMMFQNMGQLNVYNDITSKIIGFYQSYESIDFENDVIFKVFDEYFNKLLLNYDNHMSPVQSIDSNTQTNIMNTDIRLKIQNLLQELIAELKELFSSNRPAAEFDGHEVYDDELETQKAVINTLIDASNPLAKLGKLGNYVNINEYISNSSGNNSIIELMIYKVLDKLDIEKLTGQWPNTFLQTIDRFIASYKVSLDFILVWNSWKLETLIYAPASENNNSQNHYDIELIFDDVIFVLKSNFKIFKSFFSSINCIHEKSCSSSSFISNENAYLMIEKLNVVKTLVAAKVIDIIVSMKVFYIKFNSNNNFKNFNRFFDDIDGMGKYIINSIPTEFQNELLNIFLYKESKLANLLDIELDRTDNEDVNFEEFYNMNKEQEHPNRSGFDSDDDDDFNADASDEDGERNEKMKAKAKLDELKKQQKKEGEIWLAEKDLCVFTVKLFTLIHLSMVNDFVLNRLTLNGEKIGGLYYKLLKQNKEHMNILKNGGQKTSNDSVAEKDNTVMTASTNVSEIDLDLDIDEESQVVS
ncbi:uncharacterized protein AC631_04628 [Debaryomyces fabryi]|uniref:SCD domain-containing protein n=1 Tax=Debaryomyces fabryi TaxID=58627 RepID=A0A0V1PTL4_9ASCO|nr:uncharacterized protein AC631_04628 [Debaryomyces fabryi]KRZ99606.1 hypothetical protein AC631_04628 [Debaryomyces fabryi]CUM56505.1 unnamed protein product [Debaryomyces fabryi]